MAGLTIMNEQSGTTRLTIALPAARLKAAQETLSQLRHLAERLDIACVVLELTAPDAGSDASHELERLDALISGLQQLDIAVLAGIDRIALFARPGGPDPEAFQRQVQQAIRLGCDGIHMDADEQLIEAARSHLPADAIIGAYCAGSRHNAMTMAEKGADYVAFGGLGAFDAELDEDPLLALVEWWQSLFEVPCLAWNVADETQLQRLAALPADFIAPAAERLDKERFVELLQRVLGTPAGVA